MTTLFMLYYYKEIQPFVLFLFKTECSIPFSQALLKTVNVGHDTPGHKVELYDSPT